MGKQVDCLQCFCIRDRFVLVNIFVAEIGGCHRVQTVLVMHGMDSVEAAVFNALHNRVLHVCLVRLGNDDLDSLVLFLQEFAYAVCGTAGADSADKDVNLSVGILPNLRSGVLIVCCNIVRI